jgi:hypothetical protein
VPKLRRQNCKVSPSSPWVARGEAEFLVDQAEDGRTRIEVRFDGDTVWLSIMQMAERYVVARHGKRRQRAPFIRLTRPDAAAVSGTHSRLFLSRFEDHSSR